MKTKETTKLIMDRRQAMIENNPTRFHSALGTLNVDTPPRRARAPLIHVRAPSDTKKYRSPNENRFFIYFHAPTRSTT